MSTAQVDDESVCPTCTEPLLRMAAEARSEAEVADLYARVVRLFEQGAVDRRKRLSHLYRAAAPHGRRSALGGRSRGLYARVVRLFEQGVG